MQSVLRDHLRRQHGSHGDAYVRGFLTGLQCNPEPMEPSLWLNHLLWGETPGTFDNAPEARATVAALVREWEACEKGLRKGIPALVSHLQEAGDAYLLTRAYTWSAGFFDAAYLDGHDFIGTSEGDQSAIAPFEIVLSAGVQRGLAGDQGAAYETLQAESLKSLFRDELILDVIRKLDRDVLRAYKHFRGMETIDIPYQEEPS